MCISIVFLAEELREEVTLRFVIEEDLLVWRGANR